jgi:hypothetical protein
LYHEAAVLLGLVSAEIKDRQYASVRESFEKIIRLSGILERDTRLLQVKGAMNDLHKLVTVERGEMLWARGWMLTIGIDISNPGTLAMISLDWKNLLRTISLVLSDWRSYDWFDKIISM